MKFLYVQESRGGATCYNSYRYFSTETVCDIWKVRLSYNLLWSDAMSTTNLRVRTFRSVPFRENCFIAKVHLTYMVATLCKVITSYPTVYLSSYFPVSIHFNLLLALFYYLVTHLKIQKISSKNKCKILLNFLIYIF